ncbi:hypothetical protein BLOT_011430 [Blomia tropicalis]|nr:hypothetical protein BLOT_011430 [Blomia tropicalis]
MVANNGDLPLIYVRTPMIESVALRHFTSGRSVFLKLENCQPSGSFKLRGVGDQVKHAKLEGFQRVVICSGGNAGLAAAYSALQLEIQCHVVVPRRTPRLVIERLRELSATVEIYGDSAKEVAERAEQISKFDSITYLVHPHDHEILWNGNSTIIDEIVEDFGYGVVPSLIVTSCGGGGLLCGLVEGIRRHRWEKRTKILVMESVGTDSFNACVKAGGKRVILEPERMNSIVTSLAVAQVTEQTAKVFKESCPPLLSRVVTDRDAIKACSRFANDHRFLVGPACGTTLSALYEGIVERVLNNDEDQHTTIYDRQQHEDFIHDAHGPVVIIVDGGAEISVETLNHWKALFEI